MSPVGVQTSAQGASPLRIPSWREDEGGALVRDLFRHSVQRFALLIYKSIYSASPFTNGYLI